MRKSLATLIGFFLSASAFASHDYKYVCQNGEDSSIDVSLSTPMSIQGEPVWFIKAVFNKQKETVSGFGTVTQSEGSKRLMLSFSATTVFNFALDLDSKEGFWQGVLPCTKL